jgi:hypothetical protein
MGNGGAQPSAMQSPQKPVEWEDGKSYRIPGKTYPKQRLAVFDLSQQSKFNSFQIRHMKVRIIKNAAKCNTVAM